MAVDWKPTNIRSCPGVLCPPNRIARKYHHSGNTETIPRYHSRPPTRDEMEMRSRSINAVVNFRILSVVVICIKQCSSHQHFAQNRPLFTHIHQNKSDEMDTLARMCKCSIKFANSNCRSDLFQAMLKSSTLCSE